MGQFPEYPESYDVVRYRATKNDLVKDKLPELVRRCRTLEEFWPYIKEIHETYAGRCKYLTEEFHEVLTYLENRDTNPSDAIVTSSMESIDNAKVQEIWEKALQRREGDPEGAITAARSLLEAVCKHILDDVGENAEKNSNLGKLYSNTAKVLKLSPWQHSEVQFKQILQGCCSVVNGLGSLRNKLGDAHGPDPTQVKPSPRHAKLAVNLAGAMASFLVETHEARQNS